MPVTITKGENAVFTIRLRDQNDDPYDLTGFNKYRVSFPLGSGDGLKVSEVANAAGSVVSVSGNPILGKLQVVVKAADTKLLTTDDRLALDVELDNGTTPNPKRTRFKNAVIVQDSTI